MKKRIEGHELDFHIQGMDRQGHQEAKSVAARVNLPSTICSEDLDFEIPNVCEVHGTKGLVNASHAFHVNKVMITEHFMVVDFELEFITEGK